MANQNSWLITSMSMSMSMKEKDSNNFERQIGQLNALLKAMQRLWILIMWTIKQTNLPENNPKS